MESKARFVQWLTLIFVEEGYSPEELERLESPCFKKCMFQDVNIVQRFMFQIM